MWWMIASLVIEIIKLIWTIRKSNPALATACKVEMVEAKSGKRLEKLQEILAKLKAEAQK